MNNSTAGYGTFTNNPGEVPGTLGGVIFVRDNSTCGNASFVNEGANFSGIEGGSVIFIDNAGAGDATFTVNGGRVFSFALGAYINFFDNSSADNGTFILNGGTKNQALGGVLHFYGDSSAGAGQFTVNGGHVRGGGFAIIDFFETSRAGSASFTVKGGANGGAAGLLFFIDDSRGQSAAVKLVDGGNLNISRHSSTGLIIGSLEGDGVVFLGKNDLSVGTNDLSTIFSGIVQDSGSLTKLGAGTLKLTGANTYTGGTTVDGGRLVVNNVTGSGTGTGVVQVNAGALSGSGTITGSVTVGTGGGPGAALGPGRRGSKPDTLTIQSALTFNSEATYNCGLNTKSATADQVVANGVTVNNAQFSLLSRGGLALQTGTVLTVINNAAATPIAGAFANLPDGSTFTTHGNTFQVNYEGGDGNDLTLTVVP